MKRIFPIVGIVLYAFVMVKPMAPVTAYLLQYDYIVNELCVGKDDPKSTCKGACHLKFSLEQAESPDTESPAPPANLELEEFPIAFPGAFAMVAQHAQSTTDYLSAMQLPKESFWEDVSPPPEIFI